MEEAAGGDLVSYVRLKGALEEDTAREIFREIVYGLGHINSRSVLHRDIKLDNILLDADGAVKICDFGVSREITGDEILYEKSGTPAYIAPEILKDKGYYGRKEDIWSAGVVLYTMLSGNFPFHADTVEEVARIILI